MAVTVAEATSSEITEQLSVVAVAMAVSRESAEKGAAVSFRAMTASSLEVMAAAPRRPMGAAVAEPGARLNVLVSQQTCGGSVEVVPERIIRNMRGALVSLKRSEMSTYLNSQQTRILSRQELTKYHSTG